MDEAISLATLHDLLERSLAIADALEETFLGAVIDIAVQETIAKIEALETDR